MPSTGGIRVEVVDFSNSSLLVSNLLASFQLSILADSVSPFVALFSDRYDWFVLLSTYCKVSEFCRQFLFCGGKLMNTHGIQSRTQGRLTCSLGHRVD